MVRGKLLHPLMLVLRRRPPFRCHYRQLPSCAVKEHLHQRPPRPGLNHARRARRERATRATVSQVAEGALAQPSEAAAKRPIPSYRPRLTPRRSPSAPADSIATANASV